MFLKLNNLNDIQNYFVQSGYKDNPVYNFDKSLSGLNYDYIRKMHLLTDTNGFKVWAIEIEELKTEWMNTIAYRLYNRSPLERNLLVFICNEEDVAFLHYHMEATNETLKIRRLFINSKNITTTEEQILKEIQVNLDDIEESESIYEKHIKAFDTEKVTSKFFEQFKIQVENIQNKLKGLNTKEDRKNYAVLLLSRMIFLYFIQKKGWLNGNKNYLFNMFEYCESTNESINYYENILKPLFFQCLNTPEKQRGEKAKNLYIDTSLISKFKGIPYLNGGLFQPHKKYEKEINIKLDNEVFKQLFNNLLNKFNFTVREDLGYDADIAVDPELLGQIYENMINSEERKSTGSFYTPRPIISYMCKESLKEHLIESCSITPKEKINEFIDNLEKNIYSKHSFSLNQSEEILGALKHLKICDPAVGSGAFILGMLQLLVTIYRKLSEDIDFYKIKTQIVRENLYGVDIQEGAVEIAHLRLWLSLAVEQNVKCLQDIEPLPNLNFRIMQGNSLISRFYNVDFDPDINKFNETQYMSLFDYSIYKKEIDEVVDYKKRYFSTMKEKLEKKIIDSEKDLLFKVLRSIDNKKSDINIEEILENHKKEFFSWVINFPEVFIEPVNKGFDIIIGNPPYVNTKEVQKLSYKNELKLTYNFSDDLYNHFVFKSMSLIKSKGVLAFITSNTFLTIQTKLNMRELLQNRHLKILVDMPKSFKALVDTAIFIVKNQIKKSNYKFRYIDATKLNLRDIYNIDRCAEDKSYDIEINVFKNSLLKVFFKPNYINMQIYEKYIVKINELYRVWWNKIKTSKDVSKNNLLVDEYRSLLKPGDLTLLGLITNGGVGLQTGDNGKYVGVIEGSKLAEKTLINRVNKFYEILIRNQLNKLKLVKFRPEFKDVITKEQVREMLSKNNEYQIRELFDEIKEKIEKDIFGQGFIYRIINRNEIADVDKLNEEEKAGGISSNDRIYVPYDKGDKEGNRWYLDTPYYINWSKKCVNELKVSEKSRWQGYDFYFKEGFCWTDVNSIYLKSRIKGKSVHDVLSMSLFNMINDNLVSEKYIIALINSKFMSEFVEEFLNNTSHFQINDARKIPIIIPNKEQLKYVNDLVDKAIELKKLQFIGEITGVEAKFKLDKIQKEIDSYVYDLYGINLK